MTERLHPDDLPVSATPVTDGSFMRAGERHPLARIVEVEDCRGMERRAREAESRVADLQASIDRAASRIGELIAERDEARNFILSVIRSDGFEFGDDHEYASRMAEEWGADATSPG